MEKVRDIVDKWAKERTSARRLLRVDDPSLPIVGMDLARTDMYLDNIRSIDPLGQQVMVDVIGEQDASGPQLNERPQSGI